MVSKERKDHVCDLVQFRLFMKELIESETVGLKAVGEHIGRMCGWNDTLERIFEEESNYQKFVNDPVVHRAVMNGNRVMALPVADLCIVKQEGTSVQFNVGDGMGRLDLNNGKKKKMVANPSAHPREVIDID